MQTISYPILSGAWISALTLAELYRKLLDAGGGGGWGKASEGMSSWRLQIKVSALVFPQRGLQKRLDPGSKFFHVGMIFPRGWLQFPRVPGLLSPAKEH